MIVAVFGFLYYLSSLLDAKRDPSVAESYKHLQKKESHESPFPAELTAEFMPRNDYWLANGPVTDEQLYRLVYEKQNVSSIYIVSGDITSAGLLVLKEKPVKSLRLECMELDASFGSTIAQLDGLEFLFLGDPSINDAFIDNLTGPQSLRILHLRGTSITNNGVSVIVRSFPRLKDLELSEASRIDDGSLAALSKLKQLTSLNVGCSSISKEALFRLLERLSIRDLAVVNMNITDSDLNKLPTNLQSVDLSRNPLTDKCIAGLVRLRSLSNLRLLECPSISKKGLKELRTRLPECRVVVMEP